MTLATDRRCEVCGAGFVAYDDRVQRAGVRRKVRFYGCFYGHTSPWRVLDADDVEFMARRPLNARAAVREAQRILTEPAP